MNKKISKEFIISLSAITIAVFGSIFWPIYTFNKLIPLQKAKVIFSESDIKITQGTRGDGIATDMIEPTINNIGNSPAKDVRLRTYHVLINKVENVNQTVAQIFDAKIINEIPPHTNMKFGAEYEDHIASNGVDLVKAKAQIALIYHLEYTDVLSNNQYHQISIFGYPIGKSEVKSIIKDDFNKFSGILEKEITDNQYLLDYIKSKK